jgi:wyosine [tRNA(Phe)-imidazoG37] synthetase (radical SAM superfamily)
VQLLQARAACSHACAFCALQEFPSRRRVRTAPHACVLHYNSTTAISLFPE